MTTRIRRPGHRVASLIVLAAASVALILLAPAAHGDPTPTAPPTPLTSGLGGLLNPDVQPAQAAPVTPAPVLPNPGAVLLTPAAANVLPTPAPTTAAESIPAAPAGGCLQLPSGPLQVAPSCDSVGAAIVNTVVAVVDFATDPLGWLTDKMAQGASGMMSWIADTANNSTSADLTSDWWLAAYRQAFAVGILLFGLLTMWNMYQLGRGKIGPDEFGETVTTRAYGYFGGVIFGPPLAKFMIDGAGILSRRIIETMPGFDSGKLDATTINQSIQGAGAGKVIGGSFIAFLMLLLVAISCVFLFLSLAVQTVAIYLSGAVFPIAFTWILNVKHRGGSMKIPYLVLGIIFARPLLFFLVGVGMAMARSAVVQGSDDGARNLANVVMAGVVLAIAAFAPLILLRFAPVIPTGHSGATGHASAVSNPGVAQGGPVTKLQGLAGRGGKSRSGAGKSGGKPAGNANPGGGRGGELTPAHAGAAAAGASPSAAGQTGRRGVGRAKPQQPGGAPSMAGAALVTATSGSGPRQLDLMPGTEPPKQSVGARAAAGAASVGSAVRGAPQAAVGAAKKLPGQAGKAVKAAPRAAGKAARKAAPVAGALGSGTAATARRIGSGLANGVDGEKQW